MGRNKKTEDALFGIRLRELRKQHKLTQQAVADHLQIHRTTYTKYETDHVTPDQQGLVQLAALFQVSVDYLLGREEESTAPAVAESRTDITGLSLQEKALLQMFRQLSEEEKRSVVQRVQKDFYENR